MQIGHHQQLQSDGATTSDEHGLACRNAGLLDGFQNRVDRLDKRCFRKADIIGQSDDSAFCHPGHGFHVFGEAPTVRRESASQARCFVLFTLREKAAFAIETFPAGDVMKTHHAVARLPRRHAAANSNYRACQFMSEDLRRRNVSVKNLLDVCAADPTGGNLDEDFAFGHFGNGDFLDADNSLFAIDTGAHGLGDWTQRPHCFQGRSGPVHRAAISP